MNSTIQKGAALALITACSFGANVNDSFTVTANVTSACTVSATDLAFGNYTGTQLDGTSTVTANCVLLTGYTIALNAGAGTGAAYSTGRKMTGDSNTSATLTYNLYSDLLRTTIWGDGTDSSFTVSGVGLGTAIGVPHTVYGRIPAGENVPAQAYTDTITATLTY